MRTKFTIAAIAATLLLGIPGRAQSPADLLQKGIYAQETAGDLDTAIQIFRQVANPSSPNRTIAAQAQYQLVLCMLQRADRPGAAKELDTLVRNFPDQQDLIAQARKLLPGTPIMLPAPWGESECLQLNVKRDGAPTGDYLTYTVDPVPSNMNFGPLAKTHQESLRWELTTKTSNRSVLVRTDRTNGEAASRAVVRSNDDAGDPAAEPLAGPLIDVQQSVFAIRRMPLAVGYKTSLTSLPVTWTHLAAKNVELTVPAIETVEVTAGKFKCFKVSFAALGQTFWFGAEGSRPLVKFRAGGIEAELVKVWGPENFIETELGFFRDAGWKFSDRQQCGPGPDCQNSVQEDVSNGESGIGIGIEAIKTYTSAADIAQALRDSIPKNSQRCVEETIQPRVIGGQQAVSCVTSDGVNKSYHVWIRSQNAAIHLIGSGSSAVYRWQIDRVLATAKRIP